MTEVSETSGFEDNFVVDAPITPNYLQRKLAPQTCAINKQELIKLLKADSVQVVLLSIYQASFLILRGVKNI